MLLIIMLIRSLRWVKCVCGIRTHLLLYNSKIIVFICTHFCLAGRRKQNIRIIIKKEWLFSFPIIPFCYTACSGTLQANQIKKRSLRQKITTEPLSPFYVAGIKIKPAHLFKSHSSLKTENNDTYTLKKTSPNNKARYH